MLQQQNGPTFNMWVYYIQGTVEELASFPISVRDNQLILELTLFLGSY